MLRRGGLGYWPDPEDRRDYTPVGLGLSVGAPASASQQRWLLPVADQGPTESCVGQALRQCVAVALGAAGRVAIASSALGHYFGARAAYALEGLDVGAFIRPGLKALSTHGPMRESDWPFDARQVNHRPPWRAYQNALSPRLFRWYRIEGGGEQRVRGMRAAIARGAGVVIGATVTDRFTQMDGPETEDTPSRGDEIAGGHAMCAYRYEPGRVGVVSSWTENWRQHGSVWLTDEYIGSEYLHDVWALEVVA